MSGKIPESVIEEIRVKADILDIVGQYVNLSRKSGKWWGLCPFHTEKTPSFSVDPDNNLFYCFGCHKGGTVFNFLMEIEGLSFPESIKILAEKTGVTLPENSEFSDQSYSQRKSLQLLYNKVSETFRWLLENHKKAGYARDYIKSRGISRETAEKFRLGWAPDDGQWLYNFLIKKGYTPDFLSQSGLFSRKSAGWPYFVDRLIFPVMTDNERVVAFSGRALNNKGPKYINSPETVLYKKGRVLFGAAQAKNAIREKKRAILCEGNLDVLSCHQAGFPETVAPLGTAFTEDQAVYIRRYTDKIILFFDGDSAGIAATYKAAVIAEKAGLKVFAAELPPDTDPSDILKNHGAEKLKKILENPINIFDFLLKFKIDVKSYNNDYNTEEALKELTPYLNAVDSATTKETYLRKLANKFHTDYALLVNDYVKISRNDRNVKAAGQKIAEADKGINTVIDKSELILLAAATVKNEYFEILKNELAPELLRDKRAKSVYWALWKLDHDGKTISTDAVLSLIDDDELKNLISGMSAEGIFDIHTDNLIREKIYSLEIRDWRKEKEELNSALLNFPENDPDNEHRMKKIQELDRKIQLNLEKIKNQAR